MADLKLKPSLFTSPPLFIFVLCIITPNFPALFCQQVLSKEQASKSLISPIFTETFEFSISDINFHLNATQHTCEDFQYVCASFNISDNPQPTIETQSRYLEFEHRVVGASDVRFNVYDFQSVNDSLGATGLVGCQPVRQCEGKEALVGQ